MEELTKVDMATKYIREHGSATTRDLNRVLGLPYRGSAVCYLAGAVQRGALVRNGRVWTLALPSEAEPTAGDIIISQALRPSQVAA